MNLPSHNDINAARRHGSFQLTSPKNCIQFLNCREVLGEVGAPFRKISSFSLSSGVSAMWKVENIGYILKCGSKLSP
ncbi:unnamed protein product [Prunus armeniaca]